MAKRRSAEEPRAASAVLASAPAGTKPNFCFWQILLQKAVMDLSRSAASDWKNAARL
jgi:hypothetical protein